MAVNPRAIPLADVRELRLPMLRTTAVRLGLAVVLLGLLAIAFAIVRGDDQAPATALLADGDGGVIVLDLSASIGSSPHLRTSNALRHIQDTRQPFGMVFFSDTAYEAMPPGTASTEMEPLMRFFGNVRLYPCLRRGSRPCPAGTFRVRDDISDDEYRRLVERATRRGASVNPWSGSFRSGTRISRGLAIALEMVHREAMPGLGVLLISDLDDSAFDVPALTQMLIRYEREGVPLRVVGLRPNQDDRELFRRLLGDEAFVTRPELQRKRDAVALEKRQGAGIGFPWAIVGLCALVLVLLGVNEHVCGRLTWRRLVRGEESPS